MSGQTMLDFTPVDQYVVEHEPDVDQRRQYHAEWRGLLCSAGHVADLLDVPRSKVLRWRRDGISVDDADKVAVGLGEHPSVIWTDWYQLDDDESFWRKLRAEALVESRRLRQQHRVA